MAEQKRKEKAAKLRKWQKANPELVAAQAKRNRAKLNHVKNTVKQNMQCQGKNCSAGFLLPICLDFHHLDEKAFHIGACRHQGKLVNEINKCTVLCSNCHRLATHGYIDTKNYKRCEVDMSIFDDLR